MRWSDLFYLSAQIAVFCGLVLIFGQCQIAPVDDIPPTLTLFSTSLLKDPVVQTSPQSITIISVLNKYDTLMALGRQYAQTLRPSSIINYGQYAQLTESVSMTALSKKVFTWQSTGVKNVMLCIFKEVVSVDKRTNEISNKPDLVWLWTPPKGQTDPGKATYADGQIAAWNKETNAYQLSPAIPLPTGNYVWFILAWDNLGINIRYASRELPLVISK